jgi:predicted RNase H-like HicB family nuclease
LAKSHDRRTADQPFAPDIWAKAMELAREYQYVIVPEPDVGYLGRSIEMPFAASDGPTLQECATNTLEATASGIAAMLEDGETPPAPANDGKRDQQLNIRLTARERLLLEGLAAREGFRSVSDFVRSAALRRAG